MKKSMTYDNGVEIAHHELLPGTQMCRSILRTLTVHGKGREMKIRMVYSGNIFRRNRS